MTIDKWMHFIVVDSSTSFFFTTQITPNEFFAVSDEKNNLKWCLVCPTILTFPIRALSEKSVFRLVNSNFTKYKV